MIVRYVRYTINGKTIYVWQVLKEILFPVEHFP